ncbi:MFS transporter [Bombiscardovia coagulans]|uniref:Major Facilitator Superfamily n=1 Tax=Bombiscardovia coagulans TaxID=686666 RepID=A0A261EPV4_9BIFI|nr:MFS transporter [Bombiscardovia coagulans]OZG48716.1 Major Facilitator Superfamily [Bombiscardovia coagulans]
MSSSPTIPVNNPPIDRAKQTVTSDMAIRALIPLLITFVLGTLCLQGFNLVFQQIGDSVGAPEQASLITAIPSIVLGIVCFIYGSLADFVSLKRLVVTGISLLVIGSVFGFVASFFFTANIWTVIIARAVQTAGEQVAGSVYLVVATKYLKDSLKVIFFGIFTAGYQLSSAIGVFAAGLLTSIHWQYLFLIPAITVIFLPILLKNLPDKTGNGQKIDIIGFIIFGTATAFITLFFSYKSWWMLVVSAVLYIVFAIYIHTAAEPFITPAFFRNKRWLMAISLILIFWLPNYSFSPLFNGISTRVFHLTTSQVSFHIVWAFIVGATVGICSGWIVRKIGRKSAIITAASMKIIAFVLAVFCVNWGPLALTLAGCLYYGGGGFLYSPLVSTVLGTLPKEESGRGVGMNDLAINVSSSIGIAIIGGFMNSPALAARSINGTTGFAANYSNLFLFDAGLILIALLLYFALNKAIYAEQ